ncbi:MAG: DNA repair protein RadA, partial [Dongiaceae bacterium]
MAKPAATYVCQSCGASHPRWTGRCEACGAWNSIVEEAPREMAPKDIGSRGGRKIEFVELSDQPLDEAERRATGIAEFDRVTGGGLVAGSALLVGGDPGIGKSTLLLQVVAAIGKALGGRAAAHSAYISGEEAIAQVRLRARRLGIATPAIHLAAATNVRDMLASLDRADPPEVVVVDSIQTMYVDSLDSAPGTVAQVRASASELIRLAKRRGFTLFLVGHVTKEGLIAGPRVLEHMVDTVLYFEGERGHQFRILRAVKNRFGPTDEIGVFEMTGAGLSQVANPSALFLGERNLAAPGAAVFAGMEGTRPLLVEIQALVAPTTLGTPRRAVIGWDSSRLAM